MLSVEPSAIMIQPKTTLRTLPAPSEVVFPGLYAWSPRGGSVCLNSELGLDEWISCRVQAATGCGSLSK
ncbi:hypothetical protein MetexDRAFT_1802 [Methylorubrum extorquens DSM 13060]|uniref:Uncharacterized protein n=1 Tax=Methylorubrum extorquens DSM 13060 TaxID=882800 RepID=H1KGP0_METEX|nr:hypothetical protein MetexDRAFT_1802 [Methylorubrum extorquens DSM 13060]